MKNILKIENPNYRTDRILYNYMSLSLNHIYRPEKTLAIDLNRPFSPRISWCLCVHMSIAGETQREKERYTERYREIRDEKIRGLTRAVLELFQSRAVEEMRWSCSYGGIPEFSLLHCVCGDVVSFSSFGST